MSTAELRLELVDLCRAQSRVVIEHTHDDLACAASGRVSVVDRVAVHLDTGGFIKRIPLDAVTSVSKPKLEGSS